MIFLYCGMLLVSIPWLHAARCMYYIPITFFNAYFFFDHPTLKSLRFQVHKINDREHQGASTSFESLSRTPLMNGADSVEENFFAISSASLIVTAAGMSFL